MDNEEKRDAAKQLFIILGYGGGVDSWCKQHGVAKEKLPNFVTDFAREQRTLRKEDVLQRPDMHAMARRRGHHRPDVKVQATLNLEGEREALDAMEAGLGNIDTCELGSYEHDGLFVWLPPWAEASAGWQYIVRSRQRGGRARGGSIYFAEGEAGVAQGAGWQYIVRARGLRHREPLHFGRCWGARREWRRGAGWQYIVRAVAQPPGLGRVYGKSGAGGRLLRS